MRLAFEVLRRVAPRRAPQTARLPQAYLGNLSADGGYIAYQETMYYDPE